MKQELLKHYAPATTTQLLPCVCKANAWQAQIEEEKGSEWGPTFILVCTKCGRRARLKLNCPKILAAISGVDLGLRRGRYFVSTEQDVVGLWTPPGLGVIVWPAAFDHEDEAARRTTLLRLVEGLGCNAVTG